ncbi:MAG: SMP-30/gluconolactonase/LRE family protein [Candidatus Diapherotrites archaeon]|uniref:SMP-30/gluconolactonase/LRE family protein n=1 Tax=Candidatus Iainarchaeum sp. TaxID=3101447 RepID=A0A938YWZ3_9ARCH|nr:SMP-30/gluconolactonase/LRE family protein [Candidatus Diapherotrites archaeon]
MVERQELVSGIASAVEQAKFQEKHKKKRLLPVLAIAIIALIAAFFLIQQGPIFPPPLGSCENGIQDAAEEGVDCGGMCFRQCLSPEQAASETFAKPFSMADVAVGPKGRIYIADKARNRLMIYDNSLNYLRNIGEQNFESGGTGDYLFDSPLSVAVAADGKIFVSQRFPENVKVYDGKVQFLENIEPDAEAYGHLVSVASAPDGRLAVVESNKKAVFVVGADKQVRQLSLGLGNPVAVDFGPDGRLFVVDDSAHKVKIFDSELRDAGEIGSGKGNTNTALNYPTDVAIDPAGNIVVADKGNGRVQIFSPQGNYVSSLPIEQGLLPEKLDIGSTGMIVVAFTANNRLAIYSPSLVLESELLGSSFSGLSYAQFKPRCIAVAPDGRVFASEQQSSRVVVLDSEFNFLAKLGEGTGTGNYQFNEPMYLAADSEGNLYVSDSLNNRVQVFDSSLKHVATLGGSKGPGTNQLNGPMGVAVDSTGRIFVVDRGNQRVQIFGPSFEYLGSLLASAGLSFDEITIIAVDEADNIYLGKYSDSPDVKFFVYNSLLEYEGSIDLSGQFNETTGISAMGGRIVFTAGESYKVGLIDSGTGQVIKSAGKQGTGNAEFGWLTDAAFLPDGRILVADFENQRLQLFDSQLRFIRVVDGGADSLVETSS